MAMITSSVFSFETAEQEVTNMSTEVEGIEDTVCAVVNCRVFGLAIEL
jgi:hypothetical protein